MFVVSKEKILHESLSGIVIAGFGAKQHFPVMQAFELGEIYKGRLKYRHVETERIDSAQTSVVKPFADNEMVDTFLNGISPAFERRLRRDITKLFEALPGVVIDGLSGISTKRKKAYTSKAIPIIEDVVIKPLLARIERYKKEKKLLPIQQAISFLPKNELAHVAATLVSLNSFQKRMSLGEDETVGGPIDVAVISKGDGFVWIARKHYFPRELNYDFFRANGLFGVGVQGARNERAREANRNDEAEHD